MQNQPPRLSQADAVTHAAAELTDSLQNPAPSIPILYLGENQTVELRQLVAIFNTAMPQAPPTPPTKLLRLEQTHVPLNKGDTHK